MNRIVTLLAVCAMALGSVVSAQPAGPTGGTAPAECAPTTIKTAKHASGALLIAVRCADGSTVAFASPAAWKPVLPVTALELARLRTLVGYSSDPNLLRAEATRLLP